MLFLEKLIWSPFKQINKQRKEGNKNCIKYLKCSLQFDNFILTNYILIRGDIRSKSEKKNKKVDRKSDENPIGHKV